MPIRPIVLLALAPVLVVSCTTPTPQTRIAQHPETFAALSARHQAAVSEGRVEKGMPEGAVFLAWGPPTRTSRGERGGPFFRWDYMGSYPVTTTSIHGGVGFGRGYYGRGFYGLGYSPSVTYLPYRRATVLFRERVVNSWEQFGPPR